MPMKLTRSTSIDSSAYRTMTSDKKFSALVSNLRSVQTAPGVQPAAVGKDAPKSELLKFRHQYRENIAINVMSALSDDFKKAYETGDAAQKRNLENVATAIYLAKIHIGDKSPDNAKLLQLVDRWLDAIHNGNKKPGCNFSLEQNFNVSGKNKERDAYQKAVNELGLFLKECSTGPKSLAKIVMEDVRKKCGEILAQHNIDISNVKKYLEQTALIAEKNMCDAVANISAPGREGIAFLKQATLHINSMLNYPNYLRGVLNRAAKPADQPAEPPAEPKNNALLPAEPAGSAGNQPLPGGTAPVSLSNIGNPVVNTGPTNIYVDPGDKFDKLADRLEKLIAKGNAVYHVHYHISHCRHIQGSTDTPHNVSALTNAGNAEDVSFPPQTIFLQPDLHPSEAAGIDIVDENKEPATLPAENNTPDIAELAKNEPVAAAVRGDNHDLPDGTPTTVRSRVQFFDTLFNDNTRTSARAERIVAQPGSSHAPHVDTFIAKAERAGGAVTLSAQGLLRPNIVGNDHASRTRTADTSPEIRVELRGPELEQGSLVTSHDQEEAATFVSEASMTFRPRIRVLDFSDSASLRPRQNHGVDTSQTDVQPPEPSTTTPLMYKSELNLLVTSDGQIRADNSVLPESQQK